MEYFATLKRNPSFCNMDETGGHYTKWNKPGTGRQMTHDLIHMVEWSFPGAGGMVKWYKVSVIYKDE
jgi:hypothetical protein